MIIDCDDDADDDAAPGEDKVIMAGRKHEGWLHSDWNNGVDSDIGTPERILFNNARVNWACSGDKVAESDVETIAVVAVVVGAVVVEEVDEVSCSDDDNDGKIWSIDGIVCNSNGTNDNCEIYRGIDVKDDEYEENLSIWKKCWVINRVISSMVVNCVE